ncbi:hypothetical protein [Catenulispora rubra]|uniref:hypothetical protein n=1 Tax=Catenulispora rubra TaxID=280293 RepID=UPI00189218B3|nr:hypothetical protein [Catenulispora rubra]
MNSRAMLDVGLRVASAATLSVSGYIHAQLYVTGYRFIHVVGVLFLLQASASFALAALVLVGGPVLLRLAAAGAAAGALGGFAASRTVGVFGFTERGWQPSPQSLISVLVEVATLLLLVPTYVEAVKWARVEVTRLRA